MLAGVRLSNFIEEKGNKVIEVLAAAAPMPAVFTGQLFAMLGSSIVGVAVWGFTAAIGFVMLSDKGLVTLPAPEIGWPAFLLLGFLYFAPNYRSEERRVGEGFVSTFSFRCSPLR